MIVDDNGCDFVHQGAETRSFDYKGPGSWDTKNKEACCALTKDVLALANTAGGTIVVGVTEEKGGFAFVGIRPEDASTWETTKFNNFVNKYVDPPINCTLRKVECDNRLFIVIQVPPFPFTPHISISEYHPVLKRATLYIRTADNASEPIGRSADLNALVERAIKIRRGEMISAVLVVMPELEKAIAAHGGSSVSEQQKTQVMRRADRAGGILRGAEILWVDDHPDHNLHERRVLRRLGVFVDLARSTEEAISMLGQVDYDMVVSDMERDGVPDEGMRFLEEARRLNLHRPTVFYVMHLDESRGVPPHAFAIAARPDQLLHSIMDVLERERE